MSDPVKHILYVLRAILLAMVVIIAMMASKVRAQEHSMEHMQGHDKYHQEFYSKWQMKNGGSCCNDADCSPLDDKYLRTTNEDVEVFIDNEWVKVTPDQIRPYAAPDAQSHLCHIGKHVYCLVFGGAM